MLKTFRTFNLFSSWIQAGGLLHTTETISEETTLHTIEISSNMKVRRTST